MTCGWRSDVRERGRSQFWLCTALRPSTGCLARWRGTSGPYCSWHGEREPDPSRILRSWSRLCQGRGYNRIITLDQSKQRRDPWNVNDRGAGYRTRIDRKVDSTTCKQRDYDRRKSGGRVEVDNCAGATTPLLQQLCQPRGEDLLQP